MFDSITPANVSAVAAPGDLVAGYLNGIYAWPTLAWLGFREHRCVKITIDARLDDGDVLDVENGDATPAQAIGWVQMRRRSGADPTLYGSQSTHAEIDRIWAAGTRPAWKWVATLNGHPILTLGGLVVAEQFVDHGPTDESVVADFWPGIDPVTPPPSSSAGAPTPLGDSVTRHPLSIATDPHGNGYADLPVAYATVVGFYPNASDPLTVYNPIPVLGADGINGGAGTRIQCQGGPANAHVDAFVVTSP
jgi:hypothetical protein